MATGQTYVLQDFQSTPRTDTIINRYYYQQVSGEGDSALQLILAYINNVLPTILLFQSNAITHDRIEVYTPDNPADFASMVLVDDNQGARTGAALPDFVTYSFTLQRPFRSFRSGRKAYAGVAESDQDDGNPTAGILVVLEVMASTLSESIGPPGGGYDFVHSLVKNIDQPIPIREVAAITNVSFARISTQSTRKR